MKEIKRCEHKWERSVIVNSRGKREYFNHCLKCGYFYTELEFDPMNNFKDGIKFNLMHR